MSEITTAPDVIPCARVKIGRSTGHVMFGGPVYTIAEGPELRRFTFEWHPMWGPSRCSAKTGDLLANPYFPEKSTFWPLFDRWIIGGKQVDELGRCILAPPPAACDETCPDCGGKGWFRFVGDRRKFACNGSRNRVSLPASSPPSPTREETE